MEESDPSLWFRDPVNPNFVQLHRLVDTIYSASTGFQRVDVIQTASFGKCLVLDGKLQSAEVDEFVYHEVLVHPAMIGHPHPRTVLIAGGGEGAALRETLRHNSVEKVVMVDIDKETVDICRRCLPSMHQGAFDDKRVELLHCDAREYLASSGTKFDVIVIDITDPVESALSYLLYTQEFYQMVQERLDPRGIITVQSGSCSLGDLPVFPAVNATLRSVFPTVLPYQAFVPSFGGMWGFAMAFRRPRASSLSAGEIDRRVADRGTCGGSWTRTVPSSLTRIPSVSADPTPRSLPAGRTAPL
ncbi:MAG: fused MFS/spermidine synthase [Chloroflexi bacterium]|nr:fused MFS/spermidine synthase [Chloroflexota bacterium]